MKRLLSVFLSLLFLLSLCACSPNNNPAEPQNATEPVVEPTSEPSEEPTEVPGEVLSTDYITINGIAVDNSYKDDDGRPIKLVFLLYTLSTNDRNLKIDSNYTTLTINGVNSYSSEHYPVAKETTKYMPNYLYTSYLTDVYIGEEVNVIATFKIPEADLAEGRSITVIDDQLPDAEKLRMNTDMIEHFLTGKMLAEKYDKVGCAVESKLRNDPPDYLERVIDGVHVCVGPLNCLCNYPCQLSCYVNNTTYTVSFWLDPSQSNLYRFSVRTSLGTENSGWAKATKGYIICTYDSNGAKIEIPYTIDSNKFNANPARYFEIVDTDAGEYKFTEYIVELISLDLIKAFDVMG